MNAPVEAEPKLRIETPAPGVRLLIIDRASRRNALDVDTYQRLTRAIHEAGADSQCRVILVTGAHGHFTAGNDLADFQGPLPEGASAAIHFLEAINTCEKPLVAAVEGNAVGIGVTMLMHFDFAFAGRNARMRMPFVPLGLCPEGASSYLIPKAAGRKRATELLMLGDVFSGEAAAASGIVNEAVEDGTALHRAQEVAERIASLPPESVRLTKHLIRRGETAIVSETLHYEGERFKERRASPEAQAAFAAFFARAK
ncbi:MAG: enoyl-CoA hydratase-related protein [Beijerinckiaceae bacterium]